MREFKGKVAVITGAASGIGRSLAERCSEEGMKVVLADIQQDALATAEKEMAARGATVLAVQTDVSEASSIESLARTAVESFGAVHLLCNNAGVEVKGPVWEHTDADWRWILGTNLWGVIHGVRVFTPIMLEQGDECHIVNTASLAGLIPVPGEGAYCVTKYGVVALSETLSLELTQRGAKVGVSVLCTGFVSTKILDSERNRPIALANDPAEDQKKAMSPEFQMLMSLMAQEIPRGLSPGHVADLVFDAIRERRLYVLANVDALRPQIQARMEAVLQ